MYVYIALQRGDDARAGTAHRYRHPTRAPVYRERERGRERYTCIDICLYYDIYIAFQRGHDARRLYSSVSATHACSGIYIYIEREREEEREIQYRHILY